MFSFGILNLVFVCIFLVSLFLGLEFWLNCGVSGSDWFLCWGEFKVVDKLCFLNLVLMFLLLCFFMVFGWMVLDWKIMEDFWFGLGFFYFIVMWFFILVWIV